MKLLDYPIKYRTAQETVKPNYLRERFVEIRARQAAERNGAKPRGNPLPFRKVSNA